MEKLKKDNTGNYEGFKILDDWHQQIEKRVKSPGKYLKSEELTIDGCEKSRELIMRHVVGERVAKSKKDINDKCEAIQSLYSLGGVRPPFITSIPDMSAFQTLTSRTKYVGEKTLDLRKNKRINYVRKNCNLLSCHPVNKNKFLTLKGFQMSRPGTTSNGSMSRISHTSASTSRLGVLSKMSSLFEDEMGAYMKKGTMFSSPSSINL